MANTFLTGLPEGLRWLVVRTKSHRERCAVDHLAEREMEPYCPMYLEPPWHPRAPKGPAPLFTSYVFVRCEPRLQLNGVRYCPGVAYPLAFDGRLATLEPAMIAALRAREGERGFAIPSELESGIAAGDTVRIMGGPLRGLDGVFKGYLRGRQRARVLTEFLKAQKVVEVDADLLAVVHA